MTCKDAEDDATNGIMPVLLLTVSSGGLRFHASGGSTHPNTLLKQEGLQLAEAISRGKHKLQKFSHRNSD